jgi:hypothetical protein
MRHIPATVLHTFPASKGDAVWEVRRSNHDGKVYCTCPGWVFKARQTTGVCKHIAAYLAMLKKDRPGETISVYTWDEYQEVLRLHREMPNLKEQHGSDDILHLDR